MLISIGMSLIQLKPDLLSSRFRGIPHEVDEVLRLLDDLGGVFAQLLLEGVDQFDVEPLLVAVGDEAIGQYPGASVAGSFFSTGSSLN